MLFTQHFNPASLFLTPHLLSHKFFETHLHLPPHIPSHSPLPKFILLNIPLNTPSLATLYPVVLTHSEFPDWQQLFRLLPWSLRSPCSLIDQTVRDIAQFSQSHILLRLTLSNPRVLSPSLILSRLHLMKRRQIAPFRMTSPSSPPCPLKCDLPFQCEFENGQPWCLSPGDFVNLREHYLSLFFSLITHIFSRYPNPSSSRFHAVI